MYDRFPANGRDIGILANIAVQATVKEGIIRAVGSDTFKNHIRRMYVKIDDCAIDHRISRDIIHISGKIHVVNAASRVEIWICRKINLRRDRICNRNIIYI